jgi:two-component system nitrate/nitrite response regulator NarL
VVSRIAWPEGGTYFLMLRENPSFSEDLDEYQGAAGYLLKSASVQEIKAGIQTVMEGGASLNSKMARYLLNTLKKSPKKDLTKTTLSERETEILSLISEGLVRKQIGVKLDISHKTVANHIAHIFKKLGVLNAPAAVSKAYKTCLFRG